MTKPFRKLLKVLSENKDLFRDMLEVIPTKFRPRKIRQPIFNSLDEQASWIKSIMAKIGSENPENWKGLRQFFMIFDNLPADTPEDIMKFLRNMKDLEPSQLREIMRVKNDFIDTITWDTLVRTGKSSSEYGKEVEDAMIKKLGKGIIDLNHDTKYGHPNFEVIDFARQTSNQVDEFASITHGTISHLTEKFKILLKLAGGDADFTFEKMVTRLKNNNMWSGLSDFRSKAKLYVQPTAVEPLRIFIENHPNISIWLSTTKMSKTQFREIIQPHIL